MHTDNILYLMEYLARSFFRHCWDVTRVVVSTKRWMILPLLILLKIYPLRIISWFTLLVQLLENTTEYIFFIHMKIILLVTFYCMISENGILSCGRPILKYVLPFDPCKHIQALMLSFLSIENSWQLKYIKDNKYFHLKWKNTFPKNECLNFVMV